MHETSILKEIRERRAFRGLSGRSVPRDILNNILKAAALAPSCFNKQPWRYIIVDKAEILTEIHRSLPENNKWAETAPSIIITLTGTDLDCSLPDHRDYALFDTGLSVMNLMLQAQKEGLIAHPMAGFDSEKIRNSFHIPDNYTIIALVALGYPGSDSILNEKQKEMESLPRVRKPIDEIASFNKWRCC